jgi:hypothetical protein
VVPQPEEIADPKKIHGWASEDEAFLDDDFCLYSPSMHNMSNRYVVEHI